MGKIRRGGYVFKKWISDHGNHVHVYGKRGRLLLKWDLVNDSAITGRASRRLQQLIENLKKDGRI